MAYVLLVDRIDTHFALVETYVVEEVEFDVPPRVASLAELVALDFGTAGSRSRVRRRTDRERSDGIM
jgi:hypothetical protein